jgi:hypothetical protein
MSLEIVSGLLLAINKLIIKNPRSTRANPVKAGDAKPWAFTQHVGKAARLPKTRISEASEQVCN